VLNEKVAILEQEEQAAAVQKHHAVSQEHTVQQNKLYAFEEIRQFKQLMDEGIISEEEFIIKKRQLLGL